MKTKHTFYFLLILLGAALMASDDRLLRKEYAFSLGITILMFSVYKISRSWNTPEEKDSDKSGQHDT